MSKDWAKDIHDMHEFYGFPEKIASFDKEKLKKFLEFRIKFLDEELTEIKNGFGHSDPEAIVDGLIDLIVVAIGTLDSFKVDAYKAWDEVHAANMSKEAGTNPNRPNTLGLPDLLKPNGWKSPSHRYNSGLLERIF